MSKGGKTVAWVVGLGAAALIVWYFFIRKSQTVMGDGTVKTYGTGGKTQEYGGIDFVTQQSAEDTAAAAAGATAYDPNDPASVQRHNDALARANKLEQIAAAQNTTPDALYQQHLQQSLTAQQTEVSVALKVATANGYQAPQTPPPGTPDPTKNNQDLYNVLSKAGPPANEEPPPGQAWNYATQQYEPLIF